MADSVLHHKVPGRVRRIYPCRTEGREERKRQGSRRMPKLTIDGREISVPEGATVIQAAEKLGIFIPRYCYHPALSIAGNCRICLVDIEKTPKLQIACNTPVTEGMVVHTKNPKAEEGRRACWSFCWRTIRWIVRFVISPVSATCRISISTSGSTIRDSRSKRSRNIRPCRSVRM